MMKRLIVIILIACLAFTVLASPVRAEPVQDEIVTMDEALTVANNWITLIIQNKGSWGGSDTAEVEEIQEFKRGERVIGYFCSVSPKGFIVISLRKELAPVKAYSAVSNLDPELEQGMADLIKGKMERILERIEEQLGPIRSARAEDMEDILEINYRSAWDELERGGKIYEQGPKSGQPEVNYQEGDFLVAASWHQQDPYNWWCPGKVGTEACDHCVVGCVATAGAQIMRYWNWPPYGVGTYDDDYDWPNMPDSLTTSSPLVQIDAVAELCHEVGEAAGMDYGCNSSGACLAGCSGKDLLDALEDHFRYSGAAEDRDRDDYNNAVDWFNLIKAQLNLNRPLPYGVEDHAIVCDGWQEIGSTPIRQYHMNYGWDDSYNAWYTLDGLHLGGEHEEEMIIKVYPAPALGSWLSGGYSPPSFPYRYFDRDATGHDATFDAGHYLQFLPGITVKCTSPAGGKIQFRGWSTANTYLFAGGDASTGIRIHSGHIYLYQNGSIKFD